MEFKFRVWTGLEMQYNVTVGKFGVFYVNPGNKNNGLDPKDSASITPFTTKYSDTVPVMQYSGIKDKNEKEIYVGDIVKDSEETYIVAFGTCTVDGSDFVGFYLQHLEFESFNGPFSEFDSKYLEIIGNIYENETGF